MRANKYVSWTQDGDNTIVVNSETQKGLSLDATGTLIWNEIVGGGVFPRADYQAHCCSLSCRTE